MILTAVKFSDTHGYHRLNEPLQFGVPLPNGTLTNTGNLRLVDGDTTWPLQTEVTARWPDNSIRWLLIHTQIPNDTLPDALTLVDDAEATSDQQAIALEEKDDHWLITTADHAHRLDRKTGRLTTTPCNKADQNVEWTTDSQFVDDQDKTATQIVESVELTKPAGQVLAQVTVSGYWTSDRHPRFLSVITCYRYGGLIKIDHCIHNPQRARHPGGLWDLGDPGSIYFKELSVTSTCSAQATSAVLTPESGSEAIQTSIDKPICLYQDSSGGENWNSRNHVDKVGKLTTRFQGYEIRLGDHKPITGLRAQPILALTGQNFGCNLAMPKFWQNFPSSIKASKRSLLLGLFPQESGQDYELQGGERKTQTLYLQFGAHAPGLEWTCYPLIPVLPAKTYDKAEAFPWFNSEAEPEGLDELIRTSIEGPNNFFAKREIIDEYGWRNFGDLFADHETLYQNEDDVPHISHYNNQYDAIYGFARQFALTGDARWFELMDDLANHITDIDIYHTDADRAEYNHGLFWHTDHYLTAHTATHRTFSQRNDTSSTPGQTGGGPAAEHCYTTGLKVHYFLTGQDYSRQAVVDLAHWMITLHDGPKGLLPRLWSIKKDDLNRLKQHLKGETALPYAYPLTRGTGNYITALTDSFEVTEDQYYLNKAATVIQGTLHPNDDIQQRDLLNVELSWSYLVLLASLARFLAAKNKAGQWDDAFHYTRTALLHYTDWMQNNEQSFLADLNQLEFPNDTWVAQDIRKAMLMFQASELNPDQGEHYHTQGQAWLIDVINKIKQSQTCHFARIQIILLQNYGPQNATTAYVQETYIGKINDFGQAPQLSTAKLVSNLFAKGMKGFFEFRPAREKAWLYTRMNRS